MTIQSLEAFVKRAERLQGIAACVIYSILRLEGDIRHCITKAEIRNAIQSIALCEIYSPVLFVIKTWNSIPRINVDDENGSENFNSTHSKGQPS
jgi:hypothetical protein